MKWYGDAPWGAEFEEMSNRKDVTLRWNDPVLREEVIEELYEKFKQIARTLLSKECREQSWESIDLVNECCLRIIQKGQLKEVPHRRYLFGAIRRMMWRLLKDRGRARKCKKRGGELRRVELDDKFSACEKDGFDALVLRDAVHRLRAVDERLYLVWELRALREHQWSEIAERLEISESNARTDYHLAVGLLLTLMGTDDG